MDSNGQLVNKTSLRKGEDVSKIEHLVLDKVIFSNVFEKDIRRVYIYKKAERIAKAIHLVGPAFKDIKALRERIQKLAIDLVDASTLPPASSKEALSRELLTLQSVLSMARAAGVLSPMNTEIIQREAHHLLQEIAGYEEPRLSLEETPTLSALSKAAPASLKRELTMSVPVVNKGQNSIGHKKDKGGRRESILSLLRGKGAVDIKELSLLIRDVSEKTVQRELQALVDEGRVERTGERRWTRYALVGHGSSEAEIDAALPSS